MGLDKKLSQLMDYPLPTSVTAPPPPPHPPPPPIKSIIKSCNI